MGPRTVPCGTPEVTFYLRGLLLGYGYSESFESSPVYFLARRNDVIWLPDGDETLYQML